MPDVVPTSKEEKEGQIPTEKTQGKSPEKIKIEDIPITDDSEKIKKEFEVIHDRDEKDKLVETETSASNSSSEISSLEIETSSSVLGFNCSSTTTGFSSSNELVDPPEYGLTSLSSSDAVLGKSSDGISSLEIIVNSSTIGLSSIPVITNSFQGGSYNTFRNRGRGII
jgi:hypothetical protein